VGGGGWGGGVGGGAELTRESFERGGMMKAFNSWGRLGLRDHYRRVLKDGTHPGRNNTGRKK